MKKLFLPLILISFCSHAQIQEISENIITSKFLTVVKDVEVERMLSGSKEFNDCREKNEFDVKDDQAKRNKKLQAATDCFKKKIGEAKGEALIKMADDMQLENYGLIKSKNVSDITKYLSDKMTKSLTGRDPNEKDPQKIIESMKWKNYKAVDQKVFIDLYTNQLVKNALFEVSRFCFENLRIDQNTNKQNFADHWSSMPMRADPQDPSKKIPDITKINDRGDPVFFQMSNSTDPSKKDDIYKDVVKGLTPDGQQINPVLYEAYFGYCQQSLNLLCQNFRDNIKSQTRSNNAETSLSTQDGKDIKRSSELSNGANACLTIDRLVAIKTNMSNTKKVAEQFKEMKDGQEAFALQMITNSQVYQGGKGEGEESLDELTSYSSADMLANANDDKLGQLEKDCDPAQGGKNSDECNDFLITKGNSLEKSIHSVESQMNLKRELEVARIKELKAANKPDELKKYLKENGHFDLLEKFNNPAAHPGFVIEDAIANVYDARKVAEIENLRLKVGKRQVSEDKTLNDNERDQRIKGNIRDTKEERARLAQVVMFNNIITSQLKLTDISGKDVGRNVSGWNKEFKGLVDNSLFAGIQDVVKDEKQMEETSIVGGDIIDTILGKPKEP